MLCLKCLFSHQKWFIDTDWPQSILSWYYGKRIFVIVFNFVYTYVLISCNMIIYCSYLAYFTSQIMLYFVSSTPVLHFPIDVILTLSIRILRALYFSTRASKAALLNKTKGPFTDELTTVVTRKWFSGASFTNRKMNKTLQRTAKNTFVPSHQGCQIAGKKTSVGLCLSNPTKHPLSLTLGLEACLVLNNFLE